MAVLLRGMSTEETAWLTAAMVGSGTKVDLSDIPGAKVDKHSTGGVGDKTSLILAPLVAACGVVVPMMSGRGLGHTGGTLDKLESIPGFRVDLSLGEMKAALRQTGCAMIGQTAEIAPADKKLYALRDVTGTVESIPLISGSIMSKKIAEGIDALVLDVKTGSGAFMKTAEQSELLARSLVGIGNASGVRTEAVVTAMDAPLGLAIGNALEVIESLEVLKGRGPTDVTDVSVELAARMLVLGKAAATRADGEGLVRRALRSGAGVEKFRQIIEQQGGDPSVVDDDRKLPATEGRHVVRAARRGYVTGLDAELIGRASVHLGAGRDRVEDAVDPAVGMRVLAPVGTEVRDGDGVLELYHRGRTHLESSVSLATRAITISDVPPTPHPVILREVR
jgi:pyrimidine-nucleoside phosphorylase